VPPAQDGWGHWPLGEPLASHGYLMRSEATHPGITKSSLPGDPAMVEIAPVLVAASRSSRAAGHRAGRETLAMTIRRCPVPMAGRHVLQVVAQLAEDDLHIVALLLGGLDRRRCSGTPPGGQPAGKPRGGVRLIEGHDR
jgi:hypothetical protein